jgi:hypothetical protein
MTRPRTVAQVLKEHVTLEVEGIDRMYLNVYQPRLQTDRGVAAFFRFHRGETFASSALMAPMTTAFVEAIGAFAAGRGVPVVALGKGQRKDDVARAHLARFAGDEGVLFIGKAQEKATVCRTEKRRNPQTGQPYPWLVKSTAVVNQYYIYAVDQDVSMPSIRTSGPSFSSSARTFPTTPRCV